MSWAHTIPWVWLAIACVVGVGLCARYLPRPGPALVLRVVGLALLALIVAGPQVSEGADPRSNTPRVTVLLDGSASMRFAPDGEPGLYRRVSEAWRRDAPRLGAFAAIDVVSHTGEAIGWSHANEDDLHTSPLVRTVGGILDRASPPSHFVLLSDGIDTDAESLSSINTSATRVHTLNVTGVDAPRDVRVVLTSDVELAYTGQPARLTARVLHSGLSGRRVRLRIEHAGVAVEDRVVRLGDRPVIEEHFEVVPRLGPDIASATLAYEALIEPIPGEADRSNNASTALMRVSAEPLRVLVLEGQPHWDTRFFVRAMRADGQVEVTSITALRDRFGPKGGTPSVRIARSGDGVSSATDLVPPTTVDELAYYDVIVIGRGVEQFFPGLDSQRLVDAVTDRGVALLLLRGDPVVSDEPEGVRAGGILRAITALAPERREMGGAFSSAGLGTIFRADEQGTYREALRPPGASREERAAYAQRWSSVVRTLAMTTGLPPGADLALRATPASVTPGETVVLSARARSARIVLPETLEVIAPDGVRTAIALSPDPLSALRSTGAIIAGDEGVYEVRSAEGVATLFVVVEDRRELLDVVPRSATLAALAERSGGLLLDVDEGAGRLIEGLERSREASVVPATPTPLWDRWWWGVLVVGVLLGDFALRRGEQS